MLGLNFVQIVGAVFMAVCGAAYVAINSPSKKTIKEKEPDTQDDPRQPGPDSVSRIKDRSTVLVEIDSLLSYFESTENQEGIKAMQAAAVAALAGPAKSQAQ